MSREGQPIDESWPMVEEAVFRLFEELAGKSGNGTATAATSGSAEHVAIGPRLAHADRVIAHLAATGLPTHVKAVAGGNWPGIDVMMDLISQNKKVKRGQLTFILVRGIGKAFVTRDVEAAEVRAFLGEKLNVRP